MRKGDDFFVIFLKALIAIQNFLKGIKGYFSGEATKPLSRRAIVIIIIIAICSLIMFQIALREIIAFLYYSYKNF